MMQNTIEFRTARRAVERKLRFGIHLAVYLAVNCGLMMLAALQQRDQVWSFAPLFGWGIALLFHGLAVFLHAPYSSLKRQMIERELNKN